MNNENDTCQVFISYCHSSQNVDFLDLLCSKLKELNIRIWMDTISIKVGEEWRVAIDNGVLNSDAILVIFDEAACASPYVTYEWAFALGSGKTIIPILKEDCKLHERITVLQYFDFRNNNRPWGKLIERIKVVQLKQKETIKLVGDLTVPELEKILDAGRTLASSRTKDALVDNVELASTVNKLASAKKQLDSIPNESKTILWVDDRPDNNIYERLTFESIGFTFDLALSTNEALSLFAKNKYCAIISDMGRIEGNREGYVLLKEIRKLDKSIPYFIYAGSNLPEHKIEARERGAQGSTNRLRDLMDLVTLHVQSE